MCVETRSRSSWRTDEGRTWEVYAAAGMADYWLADPRTNTVAVLELRGGDYELVRTVEAGETFEIARPFPATITVPTR